MTAQDARRKLQDRKLTVVSEKTGIPYHQIRRWLKGNESCLTLEQVRILVKYLEDK